jgi:hypothetical protein
MKKRLPVVNELGVELLHQVDASTILDRRHSVHTSTDNYSSFLVVAQLRRMTQSG